uniref:Iron-sulfur cluster assembly 1 homolog, mitochondrial n=1 Tax=Ascaris lumbricoides TaxID=6252 RepID=A0A0M3IHL7_ASCLU
MRQNGEQRKGRRFSRDDIDKEAMIHQPPSRPPTLFDFVQSKVPNCDSISHPITPINNPSTGGRRFSRDDIDKEAMIHQPPSRPPTLFDFVQSKVPNCDGISYAITPINNPSTGGTFRSQDGSFTSDDNRRFERNFVQRGNANSVDGRGDIRGEQVGRRGAKRGNSNRDRRRDNRATVSRDRQDERFIINNRAFPPLNTQTNALGAITNGLSAMNMSASTSSAGDRPMNRCDNEMYGTYRGTRRQDYGNDYGADTRTQRAYIPMEDSSGNYEQDGTRRPLTDGAVQFFHRYGNARSNTTTRRPWKVGDKCLAPWNDGQVNFDRLKDRSEVKAPLYISTLLSLGPADMCSVQYDEYGNKSSVPIGARRFGCLSMASRLGGAAARVVKGVARRTPARAALTLTPEAVQRVKLLMQKEPEMKALKIGVRQRGCNGLTYTLNYAKEKGKFDEEVVQDGVKIWIDTKAQLTLLGTEMDYIKSPLSSEFIFRNPNIKGTCGCGESFSI